LGSRRAGRERRCTALRQHPFLEQEHHEFYARNPGFLWISQPNSSSLAYTGVSAVAGDLGNLSAPRSLTGRAGRPTTRPRVEPLTTATYESKTAASPMDRSSSEATHPTNAAGVVPTPGKVAGSDTVQALPANGPRSSTEEPRYALYYPPRLARRIICVPNGSDTPNSPGYQSSAVSPQ
jgi:hypothetical protein